MKGFWRAVRRGEPWALDIDRRTGLDRLFALYFKNVDFAAELRKPSILLGMVEKDDPWRGGFLIVPFKEGK